MKNKVLILIVAIAFLMPMSSFALTMGTATGGSVIFDITPKDPGTYTEVSVKADTYSDDIDRCDVSWFLNDKLQIEGIGQKTFSFKTGGAGTPITVTAIIKTLDGRQISRSFKINPGDIDLVWQADTYVPPFYRGKALATTGSKVKIIAIPNFVSENGVKIEASDLIYKWKNQNGSLGSGYGRNSVTMEMPIPIIDSNVTVEASDLQGNISAVKTLTLKSASPRIFIYEDKPLEGTNWSKASWNAIGLTETESTLRMEPYFFSNPASGLKITWTLNDTAFAPSDGSNKVAVFRNESGQEVDSKLGISIANINKAYQSASAIFTIKSQPKLFNF